VASEQFDERPQNEIAANLLVVAQDVEHSNEFLYPVYYFLFHALVLFNVQKYAKNLKIQSAVAVLLCLFNTGAVCYCFFIIFEVNLEHILHSL
jgi:hypothetical protein